MTGVLTAQDLQGIKVYQGTLTSAPSVVTTKFGDRVKVTALTFEFGELTIWGKPNSWWSKLTSGTDVEVYQKPNTASWGIKNVARGKTAPTPEKVTKVDTGLAGNIPDKMISPEVENLAKLLTECHWAIQAQIPNLSPQVIEKYAITMFIALSKKS